MSTIIPLIRDRNVHLFDCQTLRWRPTLHLDLPSTANYFQCDDLTRSIQALVLTSGKVLILSHMYGFGTTPYIVDGTGRATTLPSTKAATHHCAGVIEYAGRIFVFGAPGPTIASKCSERLDLSSGVWTRIADLTEGRDHIHPALWKDRIYICGGLRCNGSIDEYCPRTNTMVAISTKLPEGGPAAAVVDEDCLVVFSTHFVSRYQRVGIRLEMLSTRKLDRKLCPFTLLTNPVACDRKVFFVLENWGWWADAETREELGCFKPADLTADSSFSCRQLAEDGVNS